ncbi:MAG: hypothetical protein RL392_11 [Pseudomonadota bacterium]|jgi:hypothetical protein
MISDAMLMASLMGSEIRLDTWVYHLHGGYAGYNGVNKGTPETIPVACAPIDIPMALQVITRGKVVSLLHPCLKE